MSDTERAMVARDMSFLAALLAAAAAGYNAATGNWWLFLVAVALSAYATGAAVWFQRLIQRRQLRNTLAEAVVLFGGTTTTSRL